MDDSPKPAKSPAHPLQGPHRLDPTMPELPTGFVPIRLVLQPAGPAVDLTCPDQLVGRHSDADIRLIPPDVSRRHCRFIFVEDHWEVVDLDSLNGVYVNGHRITRTVLHHRDRIRIGGCTLEVDMPTGSGLTSDASQAKVLRSIADALPSPSEQAADKRRAS